MENPMMDKCIFRLENNLVIFIWSGRTFFFFLDTTDASLFAQVEFHNSNTMLSQQQEKTNVSAEAYC